ncbi:MAG: hypothetical protein ABR600_14205 [Actinomycetota bacterium]
MRYRSIPFLGVIAVVAAVTPAVFPAGSSVPQSPAADGSASSSVTFGAPSVVDPVHTFGEPDIRVAPNGYVYDSGPWGTGTQRSLWEESRDGGRTFHVLHEAPISSPQESDSQISGPGGGDTEISIDHDNNVYYADLAALASLKVAKWNPVTRHMDVGFFGNGQQNVNGVDRQWFGLWDPPVAPAGYTGPLPVNYLLYTEALVATDCAGGPTGECVAATYSTDGVNYAAQSASTDMSSEAPVVVDQDTGTVIEGSSSSGGNEMDAFIWTRDPAKPTDPALTHVQKVFIASLPQGDNANALFPVTAIDGARNVYVVWVTSSPQTAGADPSAWQIFYSYATAASGWTKWSAPVQLSSGPAGQNIMPWAVAGADGRLAVVWYGTSDTTHSPSADDLHQPWNVYLANVTGAASAAPQIEQIQVTRHPMHYGSICLSGVGCAAQNPPGNRNLADFFEVTADPRDGAIVITYDDTSNNLKQHDPSGSQAPPEQVAHTGAPVVMAVRQNGGVGLLGTPVTGPPAVARAQGDPRGDAAFDPVYTTVNIDALDLIRLKAKLLKKQLLIRLDAAALDDLQDAFDSTGAAAIDYVVRWVGPASETVSGADGLTNPLYYGAVEIVPGGKPSFFTGLARSIELCSVSGCFPHILEYPAPPYGGTAIKGRLRVFAGAKPDRWIIRVPLKLIGNPAAGQLLEDFGAYVFARNKPASEPTTNAEGQGGVTPVMVDGVCCREVKLKR